MQSGSLVTYWSLHLPSWLLAALMVLVLGRLLLTPVLGVGNPIVGLLMALTKPVVVAAGAITPRIVPPAGVLVLAIVWLAALRMGVFWVALALGVRL